MLMDAAPSQVVPLCSTLMVISVMFLSLAIFRLVLRYRRDSDPADMHWVGAIIAAMLIIVGATIYVVNEEQLDENRINLTYSVELGDIGASSRGVVYVPVSGANDLQANLRITRGVGAFNLVETAYGLALRIEFQGNLTIRGSMEAFDRIDGWGLTLTNESNTNFVWASFEPETVGKDHVQVRIDLSSSSRYGGSHFFLNADLDEGWNDYELTGQWHD